ncbi:type I restriction endonuclease subunit R [Microbacterium sp. CFBP 8790]|nr:type I restriction endonuclease subunit R [Microbacterium sp. CFBP 8790]
MSQTYTEKGTVQAGLVELLVDAGWTYISGKDLPRTATQVFIESDLRAAIEDLNPALVGRTDAVLGDLRRAALTAADEGLMAANQAFTKLLRGGGTVMMPDTNHDEPYEVVDYVQSERNSFVVADEVTYQGARFDIVLFVNGIPVVVGETKTAVSTTVTWKDGAKDIYTAYEVGQPVFFTPNLLSFATDGKDFRYAGIRTPLDHWHQWGASDVPATIQGWERVKMTVSGLLSPTVILKLIEHYAMFDVQNSDGAVRTIKLLPRYFQYEAGEDRHPSHQ